MTAPPTTAGQFQAMIQANRCQWIDASGATHERTTKCNRFASHAWGNCRRRNSSVREARGRIAENQPDSQK